MNKGFSVVEYSDKAAQLDAHDMTDGDEVELTLGDFAVVNGFGGGVVKQSADGRLEQGGSCQFEVLPVL